MEKPEWFKTVEASEGTPESIKTSSLRAHPSRLTQGFALLGVAAVIAVGGFAFAQSTNSIPANDALSSVSTTSAQPASPTATTPNASGTSAGRPAAILTGGKPSITGAAAGGDDGND